MLLTLHRRNDPLADPASQRDLLAAVEPTFERRLADAGQGPLASARLETLQINLGKLCNMTCGHCHVDAGPDRREIMTRETLQECLEVLRRGSIGTVDLTGGAPEMNPHFRWFVEQARDLGKRVIDRSNLTILVSNGFEDTPEFLAGHRVEVVASLPCYLEENVDSQRGDGAFAKSIDALRRLNELGYGREGSGLELNLVYNPVGPSLPPEQSGLETAYKRELAARFGVTFNRLFAITNMPISRFLESLLAEGRFPEYMTRLVDAFRPETVEGLMCRSTLSVGWDGTLHDCDFNQMLGMPLAAGQPTHIREVDPERLGGRPIATGGHCFGCTAGAGSSCTGAVVS